MFGVGRADAEMVEIIQGAGLTVDQAISLRKQGALPDSIESAWKVYDSRLAEGKCDVGLMMTIIEPAKANDAENEALGNMSKVAAGIYLVRTQAGFRKAVKKFCGGDWDSRMEVDNWPRSYPSVVSLSIGYRGYHYVQVNCVHVKAIMAAIGGGE